MCQQVNLKALLSGLLVGCKSGINHAIFAGALALNYYSESAYYTSQNFNLPLYVQHCIMGVSLVCILAGLIRQDGRLSKLMITAMIAVMMSLLTVLCGRVAGSFLNHFYFIVAFLSVFLWLLQVKYIVCFACQSRSPSTQRPHHED